MSEFPKVLYVGGNSIETYEAETWEQIQLDPRGVLLVWEPPNPHAHYVMGMDATEGITGWTRALRTEGDEKTDNGAIEIFRPDGEYQLVWKESHGRKIPIIDEATGKQKRHYRDVQVAEWAGPCDAVELARIANILGRIYAGDAEDQCQLIWEAWPGVGMLATQELIRLGYGNLWMWEYIDSAVEETDRPGWRSTPTSQRILWYRARRHLMSHHVRMPSKFLREEYANAEVDLTKMRAKAAYGYHDDRFMAANLCFWAGHRWTYDVDRTDEMVTTTPVMDFQRYAPGLDDAMTYSEWRERATDDWYGE